MQYFLLRIVVMRHDSYKMLTLYRVAKK